MIEMLKFFALRAALNLTMIMPKVYNQWNTVRTSPPYRKDSPPLTVRTSPPLLEHNLRSI